MVLPVLRDIWAIKDLLIFIITPLILLPIPLVIGNQESKCAYVLLLMAVYWTTEVVPVAITGLIPVFIFPVLGVLPIDQIAPKYMTSTMIMFIGGLIFACAVQHWNLHKRIALRMILIFGAAPNRLMLGLMLPTWFLSMWISNTATTAMMTPIVIAILDQLAAPPTENGTDPAVVELDELETVAEKDGPEDEVHVEEGSGGRHQSTEHANLSKALTLSIAYAANVGGTASMIGTGPNIVLIQYTDEFYHEHNQVNPLNFGSWFMFGLPVSFICLIVIWLWIQLYFLHCRGFTKCRDDEYGARARRVVQNELRKLGSIKFAEVAVTLFFFMLVSLWFFRSPTFMTGWAAFAKPRYVKDACAAVLVVAVMFVFPSKIPRIFCCRKDKKPYVNEPLLTWDVVHNGVPWMIIWLIGGGFALAKGVEESGLSIWIGEQLQAMSHLTPWALLVVLTIIAAIITEITSNTAIATIFLPILLQVSLNLQIHPLYIMFPVALATSFAFMLPVATPPNAIVYSTGRLKLLDMIKAGFFLNFLCLAVLNLGANTWGVAAFNLGTFPQFMINATVTNATAH